MARKPNIKFLMKQRLGQMASYGQSKRADQERTWSERAALRSKGEYEAAKDIDYTKDKIYSYGTMEIYTRHTEYFGRWLCDNGMKNCTMEEARGQIQNYADSLVEKGQSAWTIHTAVSAACKALDDRIGNYDLPKRRLAEISKGREGAKHDSFNARHFGHLLEANKVLGLRKSELRDLKASSFSYEKGSGALGEAGVTLQNCDKIVMTTKGKGGRINTRTFATPQEISAVQGLIQGKQPGERIFDKSQFRSDMGNLHLSRAISFQNLYKQVERDIATRPGAREEYISAIKASFAAAGKSLRENLDRPYELRGEHRAYCEQRGIPTSFSRVSALYCSTQSGHLRSDILISHYLAR